MKSLFYRSNRFRIYVNAKQGAGNYLGFFWGGGGERKTNKQTKAETSSSPHR